MSNSRAQGRQNWDDNILARVPVRSSGWPCRGTDGAASGMRRLDKEILTGKVRRGQVEFRCKVAPIPIRQQFHAFS